MRLCLIALCCALALALALAGCHLTGGDDKGGPPPGGWPQPKGSRLTPVDDPRQVNALHSSLVRLGITADSRP